MRVSYILVLMAVYLGSGCAVQRLRATDLSPSSVGSLPAHDATEANERRLEPAGWSSILYKMMGKKKQEKYLKNLQIPPMKKGKLVGEVVDGKFKYVLV